MDIRRKFCYDGHEYVESTRQGYYYRDRKRVSAAEFRDAKRAKAEHDRRMEALAVKAREEDMNIIEIGGVEYRNDWTNGKYYRESDEISRAEFLQAIGSKSGKPARQRRSKDVAFEHEGMTITARQAEFLRAMSSESSQGSPDGGWWVDLLIDSTGLSPMSAGAMVSTLREKGLIEVSIEHREDGKRGRKVKCICLTKAGRAMWDAMEL